MVENRGRARAALALALVAFAMVVPATAGAAVVQLDVDGSTYGISEVAAIEFAFRELINDERTGAGLNSLASFDDLIDDARAQSEAMRDAGYLYHNPDLATVTASENWFTLGENVGYGPTVDVLHQAFMDSQAHADNVLRDNYNYIGVGAVVDDNDTIWVTMVFMAGPEGLSSDTDQGPETYSLPFMDDDDSSHEAAIAAIAGAGITAGCDTAGDSVLPGRQCDQGADGNLPRPGVRVPRDRDRLLLRRRRLEPRGSDQRHGGGRHHVGLRR